jgi:putative ABC transport system permease protein
VRFRDLLELALSALWQQKLRAVLTTLGVIFGSFVLAASLSITEGVQETIDRQYQRLGFLRKIDVFPQPPADTGEPPPEKLAVPGKMSAERRERLREEIRRRWQSTHATGSSTLLTPERMAQIASMDHVKSIKPFFHLSGRMSLTTKATRLPAAVGSLVGLFGTAPDQRSLIPAAQLLPGRNKFERANILPVLPDDEHLPGVMVAGKFFSDADSPGVVVSEYRLYELGIHDDADVQKILGQTLRIEYRVSGPSPGLVVTLLGGSFPLNLSSEQEEVLTKVLQKLPQAINKLEDLDGRERLILRELVKSASAEKEFVTTIDVPICGVFRPIEEKVTTQAYGWQYRDIDAVLPARLAEELYLRYPPNKESGLSRVVVEVDDVANVKEVHEQIKSLALGTFCMVDFIDRERLMFLMIFAAMSAIALIALLVASLGITNTMLMSVLERVREIGIMKAVGARDVHIQMIFLVEGGLLGLVGGVLGLGLSWGGSLLADAWLRRMVEQQLRIKLEESIFAFPWWLLLGVPLFVCAITTLAAFLPSRRAARVNPILALRHE